MKKSILFLLLIGSLLFQTTAAIASYLYGIEAGDKIKFVQRTGPNGGGEFKWVADTNKNNIFGDLGDYTWQSFCVEKNEYITQNTAYTVEGISGYAKAGGIGGHDAFINGKTADSLGNETAWLFWNFSKGTLGTGAYAYTSTYEQEGYLQNVIWFLEDEISSLDTKTKNFYNSWHADYLTAYNSGWRNNGQVQVVNLGVGRQDQLIIGHHAPEPATMLLFGFGLIGLAGIGRKKMDK